MNAYPERKHRISGKRLAIFVLLGPPVGFAIVLAMMVLGTYTSSIPGLPPAGIPSWGGVIWGLVFSYMVGLIPALLVFTTDEFLSSRLGLGPRAGAAFFAGFVFSVLLVAGMAREWPATIWIGLVAGLIGAIPAVVCSWLSGR